MKSILSLLVFFCLSCSQGRAQQQDTLKVKSIEEAINMSIKSFRKRIANENAVVYCIVKNKLEIKEAGFGGKNLLVENGINPKYIDRKTSKYLLTFLISQGTNGTIVDVSVSALKKKKRRRIEYTVQSFAIPATYILAD